MLLDSEAIHRILPHRYPFLFIDRVQEVVPGTSIWAQKLVSHGDPILQGHFPGYPVLPGVVQIEAMAQAAVLLAAQSGAFNPETQICYLAGVNESKFRGPARPGDVLDIRVVAERIGKIAKFRGEISCGGEPKSSASFIAVLENRKS
jgi:3-hydroxyacyl-[acyl-carrier-protein] dehydratase